jgi:hypothetical protein
VSGGVGALEREEVAVDEHVTDAVYEAPEVRDYGSLVDLTEGMGEGYEDGSSKSYHPSQPATP